MPEPIDPIAAAMAAAKGMKIVDDDPVDPPTDPVDPPTDPVDPKPEDKTDPPAEPKPDDPSDPPAEPKPDDSDPADPPADRPADPKKKLPSDPKPDDDFGTLLSEKTGGRFNSIEEIDAALESAPESAFANEQIAKLNEYVAQGGKFEDFVQTQTVDYSKMSDADTVAQSMSMFDNEGLSAEDIQFLMLQKYGVTDDTSADEKRLKQISLKQDAAAARKRLLQHQKEWSVPQPSDQEAQAAQQAGLEKWKSDLSSGVDATEKVSFKITDDAAFDFKLDDKAKESIKDNYADPRKFFERYRKPDGTDDVDKFVREMAILENIEKIGIDLASYGKNEGKDGILKDLNNPDFEAPGKKKPSGGASSIQEQAMRQMGLIK